MLNAPVFKKNLRVFLKYSFFTVSSVALAVVFLAYSTSFQKNFTEEVAAASLAGSLDSSFPVGASVNTGIPSSDGEYEGFIAASVMQTDGKIIIAGGFTTYNGVSLNRIARLNTDGSVDTSFAIGTGLSHTVHPTWIYALALQSDGKILVGGQFNTYNGVTTTNIIRLNTDGSLDTTFTPTGTGFDSSIYTIVIQSDGKILVGGEFLNYNGTSCIRHIERLNSDGTLDSTFLSTNTGADNRVRSISLQSDGKVIIAGDFTTYNGINRGYIARLNSDGTLDTSFLNTGAGANDLTFSTGIQSDGKILLGGRFTSYNGTAINDIVRINTDGSMDSTFASGLRGIIDSVYAILIQSDGKIVLGGQFSLYNGVSRNCIVRVSSSGSLDTTFLNTGTGVSGDANARVMSLLLQSSTNYIFATGHFTGYNGFSRGGIVGTFANGNIYFTFENSGVGTNNGVILQGVAQSDGKILIAGGFSMYNGVARGRVARLNTDGSLDTTFLNTGVGANGTIESIAIQTDGKIIIAGDFTTYNGVSRGHIARLNSDGSLDTTFLNIGAGASSNYYISSVVLQSDGKVLIGGYFSTYNGTSRGNIARLNSDGSLDTSFLATGVGANNAVMAIKIQTDGQIVIGGWFTSYNGSSIIGLARLNSDGSLDTSFQNLGFDSPNIFDLAIQPDGKIVVAGSFISYNGVSRRDFLRLNSDGTLDSTFVPISFSGGGENVFLQGDGKMIVTGGWVSPSPRMVKLNSDGSLDSVFSASGSGVGGAGVNTIIPQSNGEVIIAGNFGTYNGVEVNGLAKIYADSTAPTGSISINGGAASTSNTTVSLTIAATDDTSVSEMEVCNASDFSGCSWETYNTSKSWTLSSGDETKTVYIKFRDSTQNESSTYSDTIVLDTQSPTGSIVINSGATYTTTATVGLAINGSDAGVGLSQMMICNVSDFSGCSWETYNTSKLWTLSSGDGTKTVYIKFRDTLLNESSSYNDVITLDTQSPFGSILINSGDQYSSSLNVTLTVSATDTISGLSQMMICNASDFSGCSWETYSTSKSWTLSSGDGTKTVYVKFNDMAGNTSASYSDTISLDTQIPTGSIYINNNASYTTSSNVNLTINGSDVGSGLSQMMVCSSSDFSGCAWESYSTTKSWALGSEDGTKTVYVKFNDLAGNVSVSYNDSIILDTQGPSGSIVMNSGNSATSNSNATITIASQDIGSGIFQMIVCNASDFSGCSWEPYSTSKSWTLLGTDGVKTVYVKFEDNAGNESPVYSDVITLDTQPPSGSILVNSGDSETSTQNVTLTLSATDATSGLSQMLVCNNSSFTGCVWESYVTAKSWILTDGNGSKTVYAEFKDVAGNVSPLYDDNITLNIPIDTTAPTGSVGINNGQSTTTSVNVTLQLQATDDSSGVSQMMICNDSSFNSCSWESYMTSKSWKLTSGNGTKTVYAKFKDNTGNISFVYSDTITLNVSNSSTDTTQTDTVGPTGSFKINGGVISTNSTNVTLTISATDDKSGVSQMILCNNSDLGTCVWRAYSTSATWTLSSGNGTKSVYIMFKDGAGNLSVVYNEAILLYTTANNDSGQSSGDSTSSLLDTQYRTDITVTDDIANYSLVKIKITDQDGNPISGLTVTIDGSKTSITDSSGIVTFNDISDGEHTLSFTYQGKKQSKKIIIKGTVDTSGETAVLDIVTVEAENGTISVWLLVGGGTVLMVLATFIVIKALKKKNT